MGVKVAMGAVSRNADDANSTSGEQGGAEAQLRQGHGHHASPVPVANTGEMEDAGA